MQESAPINDDGEAGQCGSGLQCLPWAVTVRLLALRAYSDDLLGLLNG